MPNYIGREETIFDKVMFGLLIAALGLFFVAASQPAWRGEEMRDEFVTNCEKTGGEIITWDKPVLGGTTYECIR